MRILAIDMGTGTQDILLFDSAGPVENSVKLVMPSATQIAAGAHPARDGGRASRAADRRHPGRRAVPLGARRPPARRRRRLRHARSGADVRRRPRRRSTRMGVRVVSDDEAAPARRRAARRAADLDLAAIRAALAAFDVSPRLRRPGARLPRPRRIAAGLLRPALSLRPPAARRRARATTCARSPILPDELPAYLTRARTLVATARTQDGETPTVFLDTGPAAALGALQDPRVAAADDAARAEPRQHARAGVPPARHAHHQPVRAPHRRDLARRRSRTSPSG